MAYTFKYGDRPLDGITIQRAVGRGGFGEVYYALTDSGKQVAVKYLRENPEVELRGISHVMNLKSPHLITIYDVRQNDDDEPFVIMEYVSGPSLRDLLCAEPNGMSVEKTAFFLDGLANGLSYLHERGLVHRDLKPGNVFYDDGYVKIGDYGLSKHISMSQHSGQTISVGTVHYMAPEIGSGNYSKAIDIYAIGVMLYEMLTGKLPFTGSSMGEILMRHLSNEPDLVHVPAPFGRIIGKALSKNPDDRYADMNALMDDVRSSVDLSESIANFDATSLSRVPRNEPAEDSPTMTSPAGTVPPPPPPLDVRGDNPPDVPRRLADKHEKKVAKMRQKMERKAEKLRKRLEKRGIRADVAGMQRNRAAEPAAGSQPQRAAHPGRGRLIFLLIVVALGVSVALGLLVGPRNHTEALIGSTFFMILGGTFGSIFAYFKFLLRSDWHNGALARLAYATIGAAFMSPMLGPGSELGGDYRQLLLAPIAMLAICNWTERIEAGRRGKVTGGGAFTAGLVGLIAAAILDLEPYMLVAAASCATISILAQSAASLWPFENDVRAVGRGGGRRVHRRAVHIRHHAAPPPVPPRNADHADQNQVTTDNEPRARTQAATQPQTPPVVFEAAPSFVGRTANAGASVLAKALLLLAVLVAVGFVPLHELAGHVNPGGYAVHDIRPALARMIVVGMVLAGTLLLVISRRYDGRAHIFRGVIACVFGFVGIAAALGPAAAGWRSLQDGGGFDALHPRTVLNLMLTIIPISVALILLFWPKRRQGRQRTITI